MLTLITVLLLINILSFQASPNPAAYYNLFKHKGKKKDGKIGMGQPSSKTGVKQKKNKTRVEEFHPDGNGRYTKTMVERELSHTVDNTYEEYYKRRDYDRIFSKQSREDIFESSTSHDGNDRLFSVRNRWHSPNQSMNSGSCAESAGSPSSTSYGRENSPIKVCNNHISYIKQLELYRIFVTDQKHSIDSLSQIRLIYFWIKINKKS